MGIWWANFLFKPKSIPSIEREKPHAQFDAYVTAFSLWSRPVLRSISPESIDAWAMERHRLPFWIMLDKTEIIVDSRAFFGSPKTTARDIAVDWWLLECFAFFISSNRYARHCHAEKDGIYLKRNSILMIYLRLIEMARCQNSRCCQNVHLSRFNSCLEFIAKRSGLWSAYAVFLSVWIMDISFANDLHFHNVNICSQSMLSTAIFQRDYLYSNRDAKKCAKDCAKEIWWLWGLLHGDKSIISRRVITT